MDAVAGIIATNSPEGVYSAANAAHIVVENNYLTLAEAKRKKLLETKEPWLGEELTDAEKQELANLEKLDKERAQLIKSNCTLGNISSPSCQNVLQGAWIAKAQYDDDFNYIIKYRDQYRNDADKLDKSLIGLSSEDVEHLLTIERIAKKSGRNVEVVAKEYRLVIRIRGITSGLGTAFGGIKGNSVVANRPLLPKIKYLILKEHM